MGRKTVKVIEESQTGRNVKFRDVSTGSTMTRAQFVKEIEGGNCPEYHVRKIHGVKTPVSNPDDNSRNNLG